MRYPASEKLEIIRSIRWGLQVSWRHFATHHADQCRHPLYRSALAERRKKQNLGGCPAL
jgi:hypothetical protein